MLAFSPASRPAPHIGWTFFRHPCHPTVLHWQRSHSTIQMTYFFLTLSPFLECASKMFQPMINHLRWLAVSLIHGSIHRWEAITWVLIHASRLFRKVIHIKRRCLSLETGLPIQDVEVVLERWGVVPFLWLSKIKMPLGNLIQVTLLLNYYQSKPLIHEIAQVHLRYRDGVTDSSITAMHSELNGFDEVLTRTGFFVLYNWLATKCIRLIHSQYLFPWAIYLDITDSLCPCQRSAPSDIWALFHEAGACVPRREPGC